MTNLPSNFLAEQAILSILLNDPNSSKNIDLQLQASNFYFESHQIIYTIIIELTNKNCSINYTNLISSLQDKGLFEKIGGIQKINSIINQFEISLDLENYIKNIKEKYIRRILIDLGKDIVRSGYTTSENVDEIFKKIEEKIFQFYEEKIATKIHTSDEIINDVFNEIQLKIDKNETVGYQTSFKDLDALIQGLEKSDLIIIAGRPSMGKTAFSLNLGKNIVEKYKIPLIIFSLEMSRQQIIYRFLSSDSNINSNQIKAGKMTSIQWKNLMQSMKNISELPIFIDDNPNLTIADIRTKLKKILVNKNKNAIIIIDYLQLMKINLKSENRVQEISHITRNLKILAKEFEIPILLLSQLSRNLESRINKRPMLSDLRESGCFTDSEYKFKNDLASWNKTSIYYSSEKLLNLNYFKGIKPTFLINIKNNQKIFLTSNHKILTCNGWIPISQLSKRIPFYKLNSFSNNLSIQRYISIKKINYEGLTKVFDLSIPIFHNYIYKDLILHNSIEQDADIVIMLYREEYYNDKINSEHFTEFIVAKHRNGPIGTAKLMFDPLTTNFKNI